MGAGLLGGEAGGDAAWVWKDPASWQVGVRNKVIMPHPHTETASHDFVSITCLEVRKELFNAAHCLYLWLVFYVCHGYTIIFFLFQHLHRLYFKLSIAVELIATNSITVTAAPIVLLLLLILLYVITL